jgi:hypothetical protein
MLCWQHDSLLAAAAVAAHKHANKHAMLLCCHGLPLVAATQSVHEVLPKLVEAADVADTAHHAVAAHWVAKPSGKGETAAGTYVFKFDDNGMIIEITSYPDAPEDEYLDA